MFQVSGNCIWSNYKYTKTVCHPAHGPAPLGKLTTLARRSSSGCWWDHGACCPSSRIPYLLLLAFWAPIFRTDRRLRFSLRQKYYKMCHISSAAGHPPRALLASSRCSPGLLSRLESGGPFPIPKPQDLFGVSLNRHCTMLGMRLVARPNSPAYKHSGTPSKRHLANWDALSLSTNTCVVLFYCVFVHCTCISFSPVSFSSSASGVVSMGW